MRQLSLFEQEEEVTGIEDAAPDAVLASLYDRQKGGRQLR